MRDNRRDIKRLSRSAFICVVSGRSLADIQKMASIDDIAYIGNHGLEISYRGRRWIHPEAKRIKPVLRSALERDPREDAEWPQLLVEDKGLTGSIHYRLLAVPLPKDLWALAECEVRARGRELMLSEGKKAFEIRPNIPWDKGRGVRKLTRWLDIKKPNLRIYIGDDRTDEDAFRVMGQEDLTILVGRRRGYLARSRAPSRRRRLEVAERLIANDYASPIEGRPERP